MTLVEGLAGPALALLFAVAAPTASAQPAPAPSSGIAVRNVQLYVDDLEGGSRFYQDVFGLHEVRRIGAPTHEIVLAFGSGEGTRVQLIQGEPGRAKDTNSHMVLNAPDTRALAARVLARGGAIVSGPRESTVTGAVHVIALVRDPSGNVMELYQDR